MRNIPIGKTRGKQIPRAKSARAKKIRPDAAPDPVPLKPYEDRPPRPALPLLITYRAAARRAGLIFKYAETEYCGEDGMWVACWNSPDEPLFARVGIERFQDEGNITYGTASRHEHRPYTFGSTGLVPDPEWVHFALTRLAELAEIAALEKACPEAFLPTAGRLASTGNEAVDLALSIIAELADMRARIDAYKDAGGKEINENSLDGFAGEVSQIVGGLGMRVADWSTKKPLAAELKRMRALATRGRTDR